MGAVSRDVCEAAEATVGTDLSVRAPQALKARLRHACQDKSRPTEVSLLGAVSRDVPEVAEATVGTDLSVHAPQALRRDCVAYVRINSDPQE